MSPAAPMPHGQAKQTVREALSEALWAVEGISKKIANGKASTIRMKLSPKATRQAIKCFEIDEDEEDGDVVQGEA